MTPIGEYLAELARLDVKLWVEDGKLRVNAPQEVMTAELKAQLSARKPELIEFLSRADVPVDAGQEIKPREPGQRIPLTHGQERIWSLAKLEPGSSVYNVPTVFQLSGELDIGALERALNALVQRHAILRTVFPGDELAQAHQEILAPVPVSVAVTDVGRDLAKLPQDKAKRALHGLLHDEAGKPFDLAKGPLWRVRLFRILPKEHIVAFTMHHIVFDGVSKAIFLDELGHEYRAALAGGQRVEAAPALEFADFAIWQRARLDDAALERQLSYWKERLAGDVPELLTPNERPRPAGKGRSGSIHFQLPPPLTKALVELGQREQASLFVTLLTGFNILLHGYTGQQDMVVVAPMASRDKAEIEKMLGYFNNIVVIRSNLAGNPSLRELIGQVRRLAVEAFDNQYVPLQHLAQLPNLVRTPLTRAMFSFQDASSRSLDLPDVQARPLSVRKDAADFDIALYTERDGDKLSGVLDYNADIFSPERIKRLLQRFIQVLQRLHADPDRRLSDFPVYGRSLADIEQLLSDHPQIDQAVIVPHEASGKLNAYLVLNEHDVPSLDAVRAFVAKALPAFRVPATFIPVDEMPLAADGSVDRAALPPPASDRSRLGTDYAAPRTPLEQQLADIWKKVLWLDHDVGVNDRFRDLGGHSLLSVQLVVEIEKALGRPVPARALATLNTVAELAVALEGGDAAGDDAQAFAGGSTVLPQDIYHGLRSHTASWEGERASPESVMVGLNTQGPKQKLFWCLQRYQELTQLAKYLGPEQPVYGMRSGNRVMVKTQDNINLLARHYVGEILAVQPQGPYLVGGNCQAALIAFQVASQLRALGHEITLLVMQEKFAPFPYDGPVAFLFGDRSSYNPLLYYKQPEKGWHKYYSGPVTMTVVTGGHGEFFREPNVQVLTSAIKKHVEAAQAGTFTSAPARTPGAGLQVLPPEACRAAISAKAPGEVKAGDTLRLEVEVRNTGGVDWLPTPSSGLLLANCWVDAAGQAQNWLDGRAALPAGLRAGESATLGLDVTVPARKGRWKLEIDMVDEGVGWFKELGSTPCQIELSAV
ncbi:MAG TPA: condensation domain-containing protein [Ramlibacter sp.]|nr:condensation domain-containing protein [Ramlibacter sp.]